MTPQSDMLDMPHPKTLAAGTPTGQDAPTTQNDTNTNTEAQNVRLRTKRRQTQKQAHTTQDALIAKGYTAVIAPDGTTHFLAPGAKHQTFALALNAAMKRLGMSSSDLARDIWGESVDKRGVSTAKNRDSIGHYLAGARLPTQANLRRIAGIVGTTVEELTGYPERPERPERSDPKPQHHLTIESHDELVTIELPIAGKMRLKLNKVGPPSPAVGRSSFCMRWARPSTKPRDFSRSANEVPDATGGR